MDREDPKNWEVLNFKKLHEPFLAGDIEWRVQSAGVTSDKTWAKVLAYVQARAIFERLDEVCGSANWQLEVKQIDGGFLAGIGIRHYGEWIWKWDGAQNTDIESLKGGISGAVKRAGVPWGIGRYLYNLRVAYADITPNGEYYQSKDKKGKYDAFKWNPPKLPVWALPEVIKGAEKLSEPSLEGNVIEAEHEDVPPEVTEDMPFGDQDKIDPPDSKGDIETKDIKRIFAKLHALDVSDTMAQHEVVSEILGFNITLPSMNFLSVAQGDKVITELINREKAK